MYDKFASQYDRFVNWKNRLEVELPFIKRNLGELLPVDNKPARILDAATGTGMHAIALAKEGYEVAGADLSPEMIEIARSNAQSADVNVVFESAGFGRLAQTFSGRTFNALLCLGNSLPHLLSEKELESAINDFAACLKPGGWLLIQNRNYDEVVGRQDRWMEPQTFVEGARQWVFQRFYDFNADGTIQFNVVTLNRRGQEGWSSAVLSTTLRPILRDDLVQLLETQGFTEIQTLGSLSEEKFNPVNSSNLVVSAKKR